MASEKENSYDSPGKKHRFDIRFFFKPRKPMNYGDVNVTVRGNDFSEALSESDRAIIEEKWRELEEEKRAIGVRVYSVPHAMGSLHDTLQNNFTFIPTEFKMNAVVYRTQKERPLSPIIYERMRVSAVACALILEDSTVVMQERSRMVSLGEGLIDSSAAGYATMDESGKLDFEATVLEKLRKELGVLENQIESIKLSGVHNSAKDFAGTFDFIAKTRLTPSEINRTFDRKLVGCLHFARISELPEFLYSHFVTMDDIVPEGCAGLMASLPHEIFMETVARFRRAGKVIEFGSLRKGEFFPSM